MFVAPSPKNATATCPVPRSCADHAAPTAIGRCAPTMAYEPSMPLSALVRCIEPPLALHSAGRLAHQLGQALLGGGAAGHRVVVAAVGGEDVVVGAQRRARADRHRLVPGRQVGGALDQAGQEQVVGGLLGAADDRHLLVQARAGRRVVMPRRHVTAPRRGVEVRLRLPRQRQRAADRPVATAGDQQLLGRELGDDLAAVGGDHDLLLDPGGRPAVGGRPVGLQREDHALLEHLGVVERDQPAEDGLLPDGQAHAVPVLQGERRLLVGEAELLGAGPHRHDVGGGGAGLHQRDRAGPCTPGSARRRRAAPARRCPPRSSGSSRCGSPGGCAGCRRTPGRRGGSAGRCRRAGAASSARRRSR